MKSIFVSDLLRAPIAFSLAACDNLESASVFDEEWFSPDGRLSPHVVLPAYGYYHIRPNELRRRGRNGHQVVPRLGRAGLTGGDGQSWISRCKWVKYGPPHRDEGSEPPERSPFVSCRPRGDLRDKLQENQVRVRRQPLRLTFEMMSLLASAASNMP